MKIICQIAIMSPNHLYCYWTTDHSAYSNCHQTIHLPSLLLSCYSHIHIYIGVLKWAFIKKKTYSFYCTRLFQMSPHDSGVLSFISIEDILTHICSNRGSISDKKQVMFVYNILWPFTHWPVSRFMSVYSNIAWYQLVTKCLHSIGLLLSFVLFKKARN